MKGIASGTQVRSKKKSNKDTNKLFFLKKTYLQADADAARGGYHRRGVGKTFHFLFFCGKLLYSFQRLLLVPPLLRRPPRLPPSHETALQDGKRPGIEDVHYIHRCCCCCSYCCCCCYSYHRCIVCVAAIHIAVSAAAATDDGYFLC